MRVSRRPGVARDVSMTVKDVFSDDIASIGNVERSRDNLMQMRDSHIRRRWPVENGFQKDSMSAFQKDKPPPSDDNEHSTYVASSRKGRNKQHSSMSHKGNNEMSTRKFTCEGDPGVGKEAPFASDRISRRKRYDGNRFDKNGKKSCKNTESVAKGLHCSSTSTSVKSHRSSSTAEENSQRNNNKKSRDGKIPKKSRRGRSQNMVGRTTSSMRRATDREHILVVKENKSQCDEYADPPCQFQSDLLHTQATDGRKAPVNSLRRPSFSTHESPAYLHDDYSSSSDDDDDVKENFAQFDPSSHDYMCQTGRHEDSNLWRSKDISCSDAHEEYDSEPDEHHTANDGDCENSHIIDPGFHGTGCGEVSASTSENCSSFANFHEFEKSMNSFEVQYSSSSTEYNKMRTKTASDHLQFELALPASQNPETNLVTKKSKPIALSVAESKENFLTMSTAELDAPSTAGIPLPTNFGDGDDDSRAFLNDYTSRNTAHGESFDFSQVHDTSGVSRSVLAAEESTPKKKKLLLGSGLHHQVGKYFSRAMRSSASSLDYDSESDLETSIRSSNASRPRLFNRNRRHKQLLNSSDSENE